MAAAKLTNRAATKRVEDVLQAAINLALRERRSFASLATLRAATSVGASPTQSIVDGDLAAVTGAGLYQWSRASVAADNGTTVIKPTDASTTGRWLLQSNPGGSTTSLKLRGTDVTTIASGYLRHVALYEGERTDEELEGRIFAQRPCVLLEFVDRQKKRESTSAGGLSQCDFRFQLWIVDHNARGDLTAQRGSTVASELARSPGAYAIAGDLEDLLDGAMGEQLGEPGIGFARTGTLSLIDKQLADRGRIIMQLDLGVWATTGRTDDDATDLESISLQPQIAVARPGDEVVDPENVIVSGLTVSLGSGLSRVLASGSAKVGDVTASVTGGLLGAFAAWSDTYRDLADDGTFTYTAVQAGASAPAQADGTLRVGFTRTDSMGATDDVLLAPTLRNDGSPHSIAP